jgi:UDP-N-acetyl-D-glucosamine dehydrogenase
MNLLQKIKTKKAKIGVIGLGYVGLSLVIEFCRKGFPVAGFDVDAREVEMLKRGRSYIRYIPSETIAAIACRPAGGGCFDVGQEGGKGIRK